MSDAFDPPESNVSTEDTRPGSVTVLSVFSLLLGLFGILGTFTACAGGFFQQWTASLSPPGTDPSQVAAQQALFTQARPFTWLNIGIATFLVLPLAILLVGGAIFLLRGKRRGVRWLSGAFGFGLVLEPIRLCIQLASSLYLRHAGQAFADATAKTSPLPHFFGSFYLVTVILGVLFAVGWTAVKMALYLWGRHTLNTETVHDWLTSLT